MGKNKNFNFGKIMKYIESNNYLEKYNLTGIIKKISDLNPYDKNKKKSNNHTMWKEQCIINFPILYLSCIYLYIHALEKGCDIFIFVTRDCCHLYRIFKALFPEANAHYFHSSRIMLDNALGNKYYKEYVMSIIESEKNIERTIFVDIHGSGKRVFAYFEKEFKNVPYYFLLSASETKYSKFPKISKKYYNKGKLVNLSFDVRGSPIEMLNYDKIGVLQDYNQNGPIRAKLEYDYELIETYHKCVDVIVKKLKPLDKSLLKSNLKQLNIIIDKITLNIKEHKPIIANKFKHVGKHKPTVGLPEQTIKLDDLQFDKILSDQTTYGLIYSGKYKDKPCAIKVVMLSTDIYYKNGKFYNDGKKVNKPKDLEEEGTFNYKKFNNLKPMTYDKFAKEVNGLLNLSNLGVGTKFYGFMEYKNKINYGVLVMKRADCSLKDIIMERRISDDERKIVYDFINKLHKELKIAHGDLKPSNIGIIKDENDKIKKCYVFDSQKVKYGKDYKEKQFKKLVSKDLRTFKEHCQKNKEEGKNKK